MLTVGIVNYLKEGQIKKGEAIMASMVFRTVHCKAPVETSGSNPDPNPEAISKCCGSKSNEHYQRCSKCGHGECLERIEIEKPVEKEK